MGGGKNYPLPWLKSELINQMKWNFARTKNIISSFLGDGLIKNAEIWPNFLIFEGTFGLDQKYTSRLI